MDITNLIKNTLNEIQDLMLTRTVVGDPIEAGDHTVIPVSKVTFGFGGGGGESKETDAGQGVGGGWSIEPVGFVIIGPDGARLLTIGEKDSVTSKLLDLAPKVVETVKDFVNQESKESEESPDESGS
ncbi:MAG: sporulation protein [Candidatus Marinimicrobia bacterium]|jgi:sporulation protein YtfJ|nr:sporulation protein [Candidatus Neomarinimicrobiota bacterium]MBT3617792.1 sporulation protein [Candidatus Neomarinimicrobiota bacterium]MBT3829592.1 sporulation protein [Candidatus Neomarinimicrobiota bacterium]MBT3996721.1 sporulation protein [Candidatus Neomarinimicrobiota bacterium]MBT4280409.1 sporulation protein [Candidatus Neomarinimicrobiota bacterium]